MVDYSNVNCTDHENDVTDIIGDGRQLGKTRESSPYKITAVIGTIFKLSRACDVALLV